MHRISESKTRALGWALGAMMLAAPTLTAHVVAAEPAALEMKPVSAVAFLPGVAYDPALAAKLPASIKSRDGLKVSTDPTPPISFYGEANELIGIDADLAAALGVTLGLKVEMTNVGMGPAIVPSTKAKRFDISISGINNDPELEKQVDIIDYMYDATTIMAQKGNPESIASMEDLCGKTPAVPVGTFQARAAPWWWSPTRSASRATSPTRSPS